MIETRATATQPLGMPPARFLRDYWQKKPLLIRGFAPGGFDSIAPNDLAGLACEEMALARIVRHDAKNDAWHLRTGPFHAADFAKLGKKDWTLLVQDVDKWDMDAARELDRLAFLPSWRIDDVMISYAVDGGGVGPHIDQYDVFLVQGMGWRRWSIDASANPPTAFRDDVELKLLRQFTPTHDWLLEPGDALYLPPGVPHDGVAIGECLTWSLGMRAPSQAELLLDFSEFLAESLDENQRYADPDLTPARHAGEIDAAALARLRRALPHFASADDATLLHWFGRFITRYRSAQIVAAPGHAPRAADLRKRLPAARVLRNPFGRYAWRRLGRQQAELFASGEAYPCPPAFAQLICAQREIDGAALAATLHSDAHWRTAAALFAEGHLQLARARRTR